MCKLIEIFSDYSTRKCKSRSNCATQIKHCFLNSAIMCKPLMRRNFICVSLVLLVMWLSLLSTAFGQSLPVSSVPIEPLANKKSGHPVSAKITVAVAEPLGMDAGSLADNQSGNSPSLQSINTNRRPETSVPTIPIRLTTPSAENTVQLESASILSKDSLLANSIPSTITVSFQGAGSGMEECSGEWGFQRITYNMEVEFDVVGVNPSQVGDIVSYELSSKIGTIHFYGTAEDQFWGETTILEFDVTKEYEIEITEGTLEYPTTQCSDILDSRSQILLLLQWHSLKSK